MTPLFADITYFREVAKTGNLTRAAERLGLSQPSLSAALKRLEEVLGVTLLLRGRTGVQLTRAGQQFLEHSGDFLRTWEQLKTHLSKNETELRGLYTIGCHPSVALYSLPKFLPALMKEHPNLELKLVHDLSRKITEAIISYNIDFGIVINPIAHLDLVINPLGTDEVKLWTRNHPSPTQKPDSPDSIIICDAMLLQSQEILAALKKKGLSLRRIIESSSLELIAELCFQGLGLAILPSRVALKNTDYGLIPFDKDWPLYRDQICLVYRQDYQHAPGSKLLIKAIKRAFDS